MNEAITLLRKAKIALGSVHAGLDYDNCVQAACVHQLIDQAIAALRREEETNGKSEQPAQNK